MVGGASRSAMVSGALAPSIPGSSHRVAPKLVAASARARQPAQDVHKGFLCQVLRQHGIASAPGKKADQVCAQAFSGLSIEHSSTFRWVGRCCHH